MECSTRLGIVLEVRDFPGKQELLVKIGKEEAKAINYPDLIGHCRQGDQIVLNTTAGELNLGTGGYHYVLAIYGQERPLQRKGHIMKLRYTPLQGRVLSVEEEDSPYHAILAEAQDLGGMVVAVGTLHSMLAPFALVLKQKNPTLRLAYLMSDGAALPLANSKIVAKLKQENLIYQTITFGHAFGGDFEAVNIYSALLAAKYVVKADLAIVLMGPGVVGTNTPWGTTALEQGFFLNAVQLLGGTPLAIPRLSEADQRPRHRGLSHHTQTVLQKLVQNPVYLPLPFYLKRCFPAEISGVLQLRHKISFEETDEDFQILETSKLPLQTMGRSPSADPLFFHGVVAAALRAVCLIS